MNCEYLLATIQASASQNVSQCAESVEQHRGELYDQYQREEEYKDETDRLELQILLRDVYLQNRLCVKCVTCARWSGEKTPDGDRNRIHLLIYLILKRKIEIFK